MCVCVCIIPAGGAIAPTQADATWREVLCLRKMTSAVWGMTQHMDPGGCFFRSLPRTTSPSSLFPSSDRAQGRWLQIKFCVLAL